MVSLVILAVALLGIAGVHGLSTRYTNQSYFRSQAVNQAYDILDRMRANPDGIYTGNYSPVFSSNKLAGNCLLSSCSPADLANFDLSEWNDLNRSVLPSGSGFVTVEGFNVSVVVRWIEDSGRNGENKPRNVKVTVRI
jgi:type IV pilus assembly protein PilV